MHDVGTEQCEILRNFTLHLDDPFKDILLYSNYLKFLSKKM